LKASESLRAADAGWVGWTRDLARDLFPGPATPFAWTLLAAPADTALRNLYTDLGATPTAEPFWRLREGYVYLNGAAITAADDQLHGAAWLGRVAGHAPSGLFGKMHASGMIKRSEARLRAASSEATGLQSRLSRWLAWVQGLKWTQADLLQVMEELEPHAVAAVQVYFLARAALNAADGELRARLGEWLPALPPDPVSDLYLAIEGLPSIQMALTVADAARLPASSPERLSTLARCGHRGPGGIRPDARRWNEAGSLLETIAARSDGSARLGEALAARREAERALRLKLHEGHAREFDELLSRAREAVRAADVAWDALIMLMAAAQRWAAAAAREALLAGLIARAENVLYLELEELKQVVTGEWHAGRSDQVQAEVLRRVSAPATLYEERSSSAPIAVVRGQRPGPVYEYFPGCAPPPPGAVWLAESLDPGCVPFWGDAAALLATGCDAWTPGLIAARGLGVPAVACARRTVASE
jgi:hypothetical protein